MVSFIQNAFLCSSPNKLDSVLKCRIRSTYKQVTSALNIYQMFSKDCIVCCLESPYTYRRVRVDRSTCIFSAGALWNKLQVLINHFVCRVRGQPVYKRKNWTISVNNFPVSTPGPLSKLLLDKTKINKPEQGQYW